MAYRMQFLKCGAAVAAETADAVVCRAVAQEQADTQLKLAPLHQVKE
jgi:hypothetical protein